MLEIRLKLFCTKIKPKLKFKYKNHYLKSCNVFNVFNVFNVLNVFSKYWIILKYNLDSLIFLTNYWKCHYSGHNSNQLCKWIQFQLLTSSYPQIFTQMFIKILLMNSTATNSFIKWLSSWLNQMNKSISNWINEVLTAIHSQMIIPQMEKIIIKSQIHVQYYQLLFICLLKSLVKS